MNILCCFLLSITLAVALFWLLKIKANNLFLLLLGLLPIIVVYIINPYNRVYSAHGFMHMSFVYQIYNGVFPPQNPLIAGENLLYPWGIHLLVAAIIKVIKISPSSIFALVNIISLLITIVLVFKIADSLFSNRITAIFAVLLSVFGVTFFDRGAIAKLLNYLTNISISEPRAVIGIKFTNMNAMPLGIMFFTLFIYALVSIFPPKKSLKFNYIYLFVSVLGVGFFYPLLWLGQLVSSSFVCGCIYLQEKHLAKRRIIATLLIVVAASLFLYPYIYQISAAKTGSSISLTYISKYLTFKIIKYCLTLLPLAFIFFWLPKTISILYDHKERINVVVAIWVSTALMYIFLTITPPHSNEYKYLMISSLAWGILASVAMEFLYREKRFICFIFVVILLLPISDDWLRKLDVNNWQISEPYIEQGMYLLPDGKQEKLLYQWIVHQTPKDAIFLDDKLTIPVFGRRQLYIGLDNHQIDKDPNMKDGWRMDLEELLTIQKYSPQLLEERKTIVTQIYSPSNQEISSEIINQLNKESKTKEVYVVARQKEISQKLKNSQDFKQVFTNNQTDIYKLQKNNLL